MELLFEVCFFAGIGLTLVSVILGQFFDFLGVGGLDLGDISLDIGLPLSPMVYVLFATVCGGMGLILLKVCSWIPIAGIVVLSILVAAIIAISFFKGIIVPLRKAQNTSAPAQEELIGVLAKVQESIPAQGYGEIAYVVNGNSFIAPAKTTDGHEIKKGTEVSICWIEQYVFYVTELEEKSEVE